MIRGLPSRLISRSLLLFFFFNDTPTTEIYTLPLHDALPIWQVPASHAPVEPPKRLGFRGRSAAGRLIGPGEHGRVGRVVPRTARLEHGDIHACAREDVGGHPAPGSRADNTCVRRLILLHGSAPRREVVPQTIRDLPGRHPKE